MLKIPILTLALWSVGSSAYAMTQTVSLSPKAAHTLDLTSQQCTIREAYFGNPRQSEYLEVSLDQPQPRTQKITLRWKDKPSPDPIFLQLHLGGCSLGYALVQIKKSNGTPSSPVTYLGHSEVASRPSRSPLFKPQSKDAERISDTSTSRPLLVPATQQPIKLNKRPRQPTVLPPSQPRPARKPRVQQVAINRQVQPFKATSPISPSTILRGLNIARNKGEIAYRSEMHWRVNGMIRAMRRGMQYQAAGKKARVPSHVVETLIAYGQQ